MITRKMVLGWAAAAMLSMGALPALADDVIVQGKFKGANGHATSGSAQLVKLDAGGYVIRFGKDFKHDGTAPDATVGLGKNGYDKTTDLGRLRENKGAQDYALPSGFDPAGYNEIYVWCTEYAVSLGVAKAK
jgi:hypothetical protein